MKSLVKVAALLAISMPLWAADMNTNTPSSMNTGTTGATGVPVIDCSKAKDKAAMASCQAGVDKCNAMASQTDKGACMKSLNDGMMGGMGNAPKTTTSTTTTTTTPSTTTTTNQGGAMKDGNSSW